MVIHGFHFSCCRPEQTATSSREPCPQPSRPGGDSGGGVSSSERSRPGPCAFTGTLCSSSQRPAMRLRSGSAAHEALCSVSQPASALGPSSSGFSTVWAHWAHLPGRDSPCFPWGNICPSVYKRFENCPGFTSLPPSRATVSCFKAAHQLPRSAWLDVASPWPAFLSVISLKCLAAWLLFC